MILWENIFGTDGFRGGGRCNPDRGAREIQGRPFLGWYYGQKTPGEKCRIVIGKDTRRSSYMFEYSLVAGLTASGADVYLLHVTTTPNCHMWSAPRIFTVES